MKRIMFVCHGNICRSPMAEMIFGKIAEDNGMSESFKIASSATSDEEIHRGVGNPIYPPARRILSENGIPCRERRAVKLKKSDYDEYDLFIAMDDKNVRNMLRIFGSDPEGKIHKLMSYTGENFDVSDPWYSGDFATAYSDIYKGCTALFEYVAF